MNFTVGDQDFEFEGNTYTKVYLPSEGAYRFLKNGKNVDIYEWNKVVNRYHPMSHKATHPNRIIRWIEKHRWHLTRRHIAPKKARFILDIGCESGNIASILASEDRKVILMDVDPQVLSSMKEKTDRFSMASLAADIYNLPFTDGSVDRVICTEVLEHLLAPGQAAQEMKRILKTGGRMVVSVPNDRLILWVKRQLIRIGLRRFLGKLSPGLAMGHLHIFNKASLVSLFQADLEVVRCFYNIPWFTNIFLVAEKK